MGSCFSTRSRQKVKNATGSTLLSQPQVDPSDSASGTANRDSDTSGTLLLRRFQQHGNLADLQRAISLLEADVRRSPLVSDHQCSQCSAILSNLGVALLLRFNCLGDLSDLDQGIVKHKEVLQFTPDGHPDRPRRLNNLANSLLTRFWRLGETSDLEQVISMHREAVQLTPDDHPDKVTFQRNLAAALGARFEHSDDPNDLEQAILMERHASRLTPVNHPDKPNHLTNLANSLYVRFQRFSELNDLEQAISVFKEAVQLTPDAHPDKLARINNLAVCFFTRFECLGEPDDLEQAISMQKELLHLTPDGHPDKSTRLVNLADSFVARFQRFGDLGDLEQAISGFKEAVQFTLGDHPKKLMRLNNFAISLIARYERLGGLDDLEQGISRFREVVQFTPDGHPDKPHRLSHLANSLVTRFWHLGEQSDLEQGISRHEEAVRLTPDGHPEKSAHLTNLGISLRVRFERLGEPNDLEQSIVRHREVVHLTPDGHPSRPRRLSNLANSLLTRFRRFGEPDDIQQSISGHKEATALTPDGHPDKPVRLVAIANSFRIRFDHLNELNDLEQAIPTYMEALPLIPDGHPDKQVFRSNLASSFVARFECLGDLGDLEQAILEYSNAASSPLGSTTDRFIASEQWIMLARSLSHHSLLRAYSTAITLLPQLAWIGFSLSHRFHELVKSADVVREGAATALDLGHPEFAVEWLEQGRSVVWNELYRLRSSFDELSSAHPDLAHQLRQLSAELEHASLVRDKSLSSPLEQTQGTGHHSGLSLEQIADRHRALAIERDKLLRVIRGLPGFERFLLYKEFSQLRASAHSGPVVILNAAEKRCDALIIMADRENVIHVPLTDFTLKRSCGLQKTVESLLGHARVIPHEDRDGKRASLKHLGWESILSALWKGVVKPILDVLEFSTPRNLSRIFWCPTGPFTFLPIHAAGLYGEQYLEVGNKVFDFVISSYVPTLGVLIPPPIQETTPDSNLHLLVVPQPPSDGQSQLPGVHAELEHIRSVVTNSPSTRITLLESSSGTVEDVLAQMKDAHWVHFACHGVQDAANPTESGLCLADRRRLKVSDIIALARPRGGLAFLSACQTATGDRTLADEAVHMTAGMLFAGYGGVVGTMWSISDRVAPLVARDVYGQLFRAGATPDYHEAAGALHDAVGRLRERNARFVEWLPFIHVGL